MKGFTLIELLAVLVILAIIMTITTPIVLNVIEESKTSANLTQAEMILDASEKFYNINIINDENIDKFNGKSNVYDLIVTSGNKPDEGIVVISEDGKISLTLYIDGKCYEKNYLSNSITISDVSKEKCDAGKEISDQNLFLNGATPKLTDGLYPIMIEPEGTVVLVDEDSIWYDYEDKFWANAVAIKDSVNRELYSQAVAGTVIDASHIAAYYVWIPRYEYMVWDIPQTSPTWGEDKNEMQEISIKFGGKDEIKKTTTAVGDWFTHPAFSYFDGITTTEINGFWVNKFELTGDASNPTSLPLSTPLRNLNLSDYFDTIKSFEDLYFDSSDRFDSHLIKNSEWAAIAYLSSSIYGKNSEVLPNNYQSQNTGCGANEDNVKGVSTCLNAFGTVTNDIYNSSTTGNISGVFDMSGGLWERTMGLQLNSSGQIDFGASGFTELNSKYYDVYEHSTAGNQYGNSGYGQAISETAGWYNDYSSIPNGSTNHWTLRSGDQNGGTSSGVFGFMTSTGTSYWTHGTRGTLWVYE